MISKTKAEEIITCDSYKPMCDFVYDYDNLSSTPESGVIHVPTDQLDRFIKTNGNNGKEYTLVSSKSDFGVFYQNQSPVWMDMVRWLTMVPYLEESNIEQIGYNDLTIQTRCDLSRCNPNHKYSIKCWSYTNATFNEIPSNIKNWFLTNCMIDEAEGIPFGIMDKTQDDMANAYTQDKPNMLYVNFQLNNVDRKTLMDYFLAASLNWVTVRNESIPFKDYLSEMASHKFILCPDGNGPDCYRTWEALYAGSIPIISKSKATSFFKDLPVLILDESNDVDYNFLETKYNEIMSMDWDMDKITKSYWQSRFAS